MNFIKIPFILNIMIYLIKIILIIIYNNNLILIIKKNNKSINKNHNRIIIKDLVYVIIIAIVNAVYYINKWLKDNMCYNSNNKKLVKRKIAYMNFNLFRLTMNTHNKHKIF